MATRRQASAEATRSAVLVPISNPLRKPEASPPQSSWSGGKGRLTRGLRGGVERSRLEVLGRLVECRAIRGRQVGGADHDVLGRQALDEIGFARIDLQPELVVEFRLGLGRVGVQAGVG